jgi:hypothetical protein
MIDDDALLKAIQFQKDNAYGSNESSVLGQKRARAIEYYLGLNTNPAPEGRSQVVDRSVYETIQVMLPSLVKIFSGSSDEICKAVPIGPDDEEAADQTTAVLRYYVTEKNQWEQICSDWIHDALLMNNGYTMAYWDESKRKVRETYESQSDEQVAAILQDPDVTVIQHDQEVDDEATAEAMLAYQNQMQQYQQMAQQAMMQGQQPPPPPPQPQPVLEHDLVIEREENDGKVCIKTLAPEHCIVSADTPDWTLNDCPYFEFKQQKTIDDLRKMGLEVEEDVSDDENIDAIEDLSRDRFGENTFHGNFSNPDGITRQVWTRMIWIRADAEGDGVARLYYVIAVGKTILYKEPCSTIPVSSMTSEPLPHRHIGMSVAESVMDIQDIKQAVKRGALDNLYLANNGRHIISSKVNVEDFLDARPGGVIRMLDESLPGEGHVIPLVHPFSFDTIIGSLEYFDQDRQNRTGASRYFSGTDAGAINKTASGTIALQNMASMRIEHKARMMAPAVENLFRIVWEIISKHANKGLTLKLKGKWALVDPQAWRTRRDIRISVGVGAGNKETMMQQLAQIFGAQMQLMPIGVAGPEQIHATVLEMAKLSGFANPDKFWVDPRQHPPPPAPPNPDLMKIQADQQKTQATIQADGQKTQAQMAHEAELKRQELLAQAIENEKNRQADLEKARMSEATKLAIAEMNRSTQMETTAATQSFEAQKLGATFQREDQKAQQEQAQVQEKDDGMAELLSNLQGAIKSLADGMNRPKQVIRGPDGKVVGVQ